MKKKQPTLSTQKENRCEKKRKERQGKVTLIRKYSDNLINKTKTAASLQNIKNFYDTTRNISIEQVQGNQQPKLEI